MFTVIPCAQQELQATTKGPQIYTAGFCLIGLYLFLFYSRLQDSLDYLHLPMVILALATIALFTSGSAMVFHRRIILWMCLFTVCIAGSIPFSVWPSGASDKFVNIWLKSAWAFVLVSGLVRTPEQLTRACSCIAVASIFQPLFAIVSNSVQLNRLGGISVTFQDANYFAQFLLVGMCFVLFYATKPGRPLLLRMAAVVALALELVSFLRTGSRGGLIGLFTVLALWFFKTSARTRLILITAGVVGVPLAIHTFPESMSRYSTIFETKSASSDDATDEAAAIAEASAEARQYLLIQSLRITFQHPIFGIGIGMFDVAENDLAREQGLPKGSWHDTHNMFTQVSSEAGIPALICFLFVLGYAFKGLNRSLKLSYIVKNGSMRDVAHTAFWLRLALVSMLSSGIFLNIAYTQNLHILVALASALGAATASEGIF